jgi:hypothetical protein
MSWTRGSLRRPWRPWLCPSAARKCGSLWDRERDGGAHLTWMLTPGPCRVSEFLMGEVDSSTLLAVPPGDPSQVSRSRAGQTVSRQGLKGISGCVWGRWSPPARQASPGAKLKAHVSPASLLCSPWRTCMDRGVRAPHLAPRTVMRVSVPKWQGLVHGRGAGW